MINQLKENIYKDFNEEKRYTNGLLDAHHKRMDDLEQMIIEHVERTNEDGSVSWIPIEPSNSDYQAYLKWVEYNNG